MKWYERLGFTGKFERSIPPPKQKIFELVTEYFYEDFYTDPDNYESSYSRENEGSHL